MTELEFIKQEFLRNANPLVVFRGNTENNKKANIFQRHFNEGLKRIKEANSVDSVMSIIKEEREFFLQQWNNLDRTTINYDEEPAFKYLKESFFNYHLNSPDDWINQVKERFEQKSKNNFFTKIEEGFNFLQKKISEYTNQAIDYDQVRAKSFELIEKYNLKAIDLSDIPQNKAMDFLNQFEKIAQDFQQNLGVAPDVLGIHGTITISARDRMEAFFSPVANSINLGSGMRDTSTLLHEWIHALDFHIGSKYGKYQYATDIEHSVYDDGSDLHKAFKAMKSLSQEIYSSNPEAISAIKENMIKEGNAKFWNDFLGDDSYMLSNEKRAKLQSEESFKIVNNFLSAPSSGNAQKSMLNFIESLGLLNPQRIARIYNSDSNDPIFENKSYFDNVNKNILNGKSLYYATSYLSRYSQKLQVFAMKGFEKIKAAINPNTKQLVTGNSFDDNYFVNPLEMMARYFESQVFNKKSNIVNIINLCAGTLYYKINKDENFEENKNKILTHVFGKDKVLANLQQMRVCTNPQNQNTSQYKI